MTTLKKPEKVDIYLMQHGAIVRNTWREEGYNQSHAEWTAYTDQLLKPLEEVYERFKHLDKLFNDPLITDRESLPEAAQYEFWNSIKTVIESWKGSKNA